MVEVWFAPNGHHGRNPQRSWSCTARPIAAGAIVWALGDADGSVAAAMRPGGRLSIRIHCGFIQAGDGRIYSAALDAVTGVTTLKGAGGVHETWFFVTP